jgi:Domain of unknown function (DUF4149)
MFSWFTFHVTALVVVAALFGGMLMFMAVFAPLVFRTLPEATAAAFMRALFPVYYRVGGVLALIAALPLVPARSYMPEIAILIVVAAGFVVANKLLRPRLNRARDESRTGDFRRLHGASMLLHLAQFLAVAVVLVRLAQ